VWLQQAAGQEEVDSQHHRRHGRGRGPPGQCRQHEPDEQGRGDHPVLCGQLGDHRVVRVDPLHVEEAHAGALGDDARSAADQKGHGVPGEAFGDQRVGRHEAGLGARALLGPLGRAACQDPPGQRALDHRAEQQQQQNDPDRPRRSTADGEGGEPDAGHDEARARHGGQQARGVQRETPAAAAEEQLHDQGDSEELGAEARLQEDDAVRLHQR
jgi:hypothetical protein